MPPSNGVDLDSTSGPPRSTQFHGRENKVDLFHQDRAPQRIRERNPTTAADPKPAQARPPGSFGVGPHPLQCGLQYIISFFLKIRPDLGTRGSRRRPTHSSKGDRRVNRRTRRKVAKAVSRENDWQRQWLQACTAGASRRAGVASKHCGAPPAPCATARGRPVATHRKRMQRSKNCFPQPSPAARAGCRSHGKAAQPNSITWQGASRRNGARLSAAIPETRYWRRNEKWRE
jgi:hypothetical protein